SGTSCTLAVSGPESLRSSAELSCHISRSYRYYDVHSSTCPTVGKPLGRGYDYRENGHVPLATSTHCHPHRVPRMDGGESIVACTVHRHPERHEDVIRENSRLFPP